MNIEFSTSNVTIHPSGEKKELINNFFFLLSFSDGKQEPVQKPKVEKLKIQRWNTYYFFCNRSKDYYPYFNYSKSNYYCQRVILEWKIFKRSAWLAFEKRKKIVNFRL